MHRRALASYTNLLSIFSSVEFAHPRKCFIVKFVLLFFCVNYGAIQKEKESFVVQSDRLIHLYYVNSYVTMNSFYIIKKLYKSKTN